MSSIDTSGIDPTKPVQGNPLTANVRANTAAIKTQLENAGLDIDTINTFLAGIDSDSTNDQTKSEIDTLILKGLANGYATLDAGAKIPSAQLPALALTDIFEVASEVAMIALTAQEGDIAVRSDENKTYAHNGGVVGDATDWTRLKTPTDLVLSVSGNTGVVTAAQLKTAYEALADTNAYTDSEQSSLSSLDTAIDTTNTDAKCITFDVNEDAQFVGTAQFAAGEGVVFNGDAITAANTLDDYEEGTWTPDLYGATTAGTATQTTTVGLYNKVGNIVHVNCRITISNKGGMAGAVYIGGLPFVSSSVSGNKQGFYITEMNETTSANRQFVLSLTESTSFVMYKALREDGANTVSVDSANIGNAFHITFNGVYYV